MTAQQIEDGARAVCAASNGTTGVWNAFDSEEGRDHYRVMFNAALAFIREQCVEEWPIFGYGEPLVEELEAFLSPPSESGEQRTP